jgi:ribosomal protein S18 acetylase RimI-like enzyme
MTEIQITPAGLNDRALIRSISERTWPSTYGHIISQEQINFMLDWMYSDESLATQMNTGCEFYIASIKKEDGQWDEIGFCSVSPDDEKVEKEGESNNATEKSEKSSSYKLNKLYVLPSAQGTGAGKALLNQAIAIAKVAGSSSIFLQVNKHNNAYNFYLKQGFIKETEFKFDIGNGFYMDDYVMRLTF